MRGGVEARREATLLTDKAAAFLAAGPADVVDLIGHICNLPGAPRIVAEHMANAMFAGRAEFSRDSFGKWLLTDARFDGVPRRSAGPPIPAVPLTALSYVVVDVETTGGRAYRGDRITEIAAVVVDRGEISEVYETLVNPQRPIPAFITQLTNITWEMVRDAPTFDAIAPKVLQTLEGHVFVAHNAAFDWRFVSAELTRAMGMRLAGRKLCTIRLARRLLPQLRRRSLDHVANYYGVEISGRHRAAGDALATARCLLRLLEDAAQRGCLTWDDLDFLLGARVARKRRKLRAMPSPVKWDTTA